MALKILELFGGIGACTCALKRMGVPIEIVDYVEIDKYAVASYNAINGTNFAPQDVKKWDKDVQVDFILHGSPCQDFSLAGLQKGGDKDSGTRSSLMYETLRIVKKLKPKYVIWENVANLLSQKHFHNFANYLNAMASFGYANAYKLLNAKDYGIPQNRERVFTVSVLNGHTVDLLGEELLFEFPQPIPLKLRLKDMLEDNVDEKYYLSEKGINYILNDERIGGVHQCESSRSDMHNCEGADELDRNVCRTIILALDEQNRYIRNDGCVGSLTTDGSSPKHNNRIIESTHTHTESDADQDG